LSVGIGWIVPMRAGGHGPAPIASSIARVQDRNPVRARRGRVSEREPVAILPGSIGSIARSRGDTLHRQARAKTLYLGPARSFAKAAKEDSVPKRGPRQPRINGSIQR
jgi:hypothetical protein